MPLLNHFLPVMYETSLCLEQDDGLALPLGKSITPGCNSNSAINGSLGNSVKFFNPSLNRRFPFCLSEFFMLSSGVLDQEAAFFILDRLSSDNRRPRVNDSSLILGSVGLSLNELTPSLNHSLPALFSRQGFQRVG